MVQQEAVLIFCADPMDSRKPDSAYQIEVKTADELDFESGLISYEALVYEGDSLRATRKIEKRSEPVTGIYRGWMLKPHHYEKLYDALKQRGIILINDPRSYKHCHYLPECYSVIEGHTPSSVWLKTDLNPNISQVMELLRPFGSKPIIVKDFVKSQKYYWKEACYIASASDQNIVERVVHRFLDLQRDDLNEGLVFREFIEFESLGMHSKSDMPLTKEFRVFFLDAKPLYSTQYWDEGDYHDTQPDLKEFFEIAKTVRSRFFTMDVAKKIDGSWLIVELGDGQVSGLPENADIKAFYQSLKDHGPLIIPTENAST